MPKQRILAVALVFSLVLNIVGIVFVIMFFNSQKRLHNAKRDSAQYLNLYTAARTAALASMDKPDSAYRRDFRSHLDGEPDSFLVSPPSPITGGSPPPKEYSLIVYLHGMGSSPVEPFVYPEKRPFNRIVQEENGQVVMASLSYRKRASWGNEKALSDITQNIREMMQEYPVKNIFLVGMSMGGCVSLIYATQAPDDIRSKIKGIMAVEGAAELTSLYKATAAAVVRDAITEAYDGSPDSNPALYRKLSFFNNIDRLSPDTKVTIITANHDTTVPPSVSQEVAERLSRRGIQLKVIAINGVHQPPDEQYWREALAYLIAER